MNREEEMKTSLTKLIQEWESEVVEFKQAGKDYSTINQELLLVVITVQSRSNSKPRPQKSP